MNTYTILGVVGSKTFDDYDLLGDTLNGIDELKVNDKLYILNISVIVSGGAKGADSLAEKCALKNNIPTKIFKSDWNKCGKQKL